LERIAAVKPILETRLQDLSASFSEYVEVFKHGGPFSELQLRAHLKALSLRSTFPFAAGAVKNPEFADAVRDVLGRWGVGTRGAELLSVESFRAEIGRLAPSLTPLEQMEIDDALLDVPKVASSVWDVINSMCLVTKNGKPVKNKVVSGTKALHHVLPKLVFPVDREYTQTFFGWHNPEFQDNPRDCFVLIFSSLAELAREVNLANFVGKGWTSSPAKILDNAIVGYCVKHGLRSENTRYQQKQRDELKALKKRAKELGIWEEIKSESLKRANATPIQRKGNY
jgi:hypothetical protein